MDKPWKLGNKLNKKWEKNKNIKWKYVKGKRTPFRNGKELKIGTRPKELIKAAGSDLSNAFRDFLKIGRLGKNPQFDVETGRPLNLLEAQRLNKLNDEKLENYDDSADVAAYQKYEKGANKSNTLEMKLADLRRKNQETSVGPPEKSVQYGGGSGSRKVDGKALMDQLRSERSDNIQPSTVHTRHYETGERLGVMTRSQRRAYEEKAAGRTFESEVAKYEKSSGHGKSHKRETLYKRKNKKKLSIDD